MFYNLKLECLVLTTFIYLALMNRLNQILNGYKKEKGEYSNENLYFFECDNYRKFVEPKTSNIFW